MSRRAGIAQARLSSRGADARALIFPFLISDLCQTGTRPARPSNGRQGRRAELKVRVGAKNENASALGLSTRRPRHSDLALLGEAAAIAKMKQAAARSEPPPAGKSVRPGVYLTFVRTVRSNLVATMKVGLHQWDWVGLVPLDAPRRSLVSAKHSCLVVSVS